MAYKAVRHRTPGMPFAAVQSQADLHKKCGKCLHSGTFFIPGAEHLLLQPSHMLSGKDRALQDFQLHKFH